MRSITNSHKELRIQVKKEQDYFKSVKGEMESTVKNIIKSTPLKDYSVIVERLEVPSLKEE